MNKHTRFLATSSILALAAIGSTFAVNGKEIRHLLAGNTYGVSQEAIVFDSNNVNPVTKYGNTIQTKGSNTKDNSLWYQAFMGEPGVYNSTPIQAIHRIEVTWDCNSYAGLKLRVGSSERGSDVAAAAMAPKNGTKVPSGSVFALDIAEPTKAHYWSFGGKSGIQVSFCVYKIVSVKVIYSCH